MLCLQHRPIAREQWLENLPVANSHYIAWISSCLTVFIKPNLQETEKSPENLSFWLQGKKECCSPHDCRNKRKKCIFAVLLICWRLIKPEAKLNISQNALCLKYFFFLSRKEKKSEKGLIFFKPGKSNTGIQVINFSWKQRKMGSFLS